MKRRRTLSLPGKRQPKAGLPEPTLSAPPAAALLSAAAVPVPVVQPAPEPCAVNLSDWNLTGEAIVGLAHRRNGLPCQDAVAWRHQSRPILVLSDGAGSAAASELGAAALVTGMARLLTTMEDALAPWLDSCGDEAMLQQRSAQWSIRLLLHAQGLLQDLAQTERRSVRDLRATLLVAVVGRQHLYWWQVGDGTAVIQHAQGLRALGTPGQSKGEFANQTCFVDMASAADVQCGLLPCAEVFGIALMSDGGAEKLVAHDGSKVAGRMNQWFADVTRQALTPDKIALAYHDPSMWERTTLDDRSIVLAARTMPTPQTP